MLVEIKFADFQRAMNKCKETPMGLYNFLDAIILLDRQGSLQQLKDLAQSLLDQYRTPKSVLKSISHWLESSLIKIKAAKEDNDDLKASFVV
ncbi:hypothetical protein GCM10025859_17480 [Alicyclobacillus fastidiosus]|nr:hypothetical protein GCM10025859_17480 [Alicyclobacillus fastidiosus]